VPEKGVDTLIEAFKKVKTGKSLAIVGDATHTEGYLARCKGLAKDDPRIIFTGPLYGTDKTEAYSNASLFVLPSTIEGMPVVLLEAMSFGLCPLVSDIEENLDVLEGCGYSFKTRDTGDLTRQIEKALAAKGTELLGQKGKALVEKGYQWPRIARQTLELYNAP
jgi:glycosyltransferase involved in cell wall biosynthesis